MAVASCFIMHTNQLIGTFDPIPGNLPSVGSGINGSIRLGDYWTIINAGNIAGLGQMAVGEILFSATDNAAVASDYFVIPIESVNRLNEIKDMNTYDTSILFVDRVTSQYRDVLVAIKPPKRQHICRFDLSSWVARDQLFVHTIDTQALGLRPENLNSYIRQLGPEFAKIDIKVNFVTGIIEIESDRKFAGYIVVCGDVI